MFRDKKKYANFVNDSKYLSYLYIVYENIVFISLSFKRF